MAADKRGAHLALTLERLDDLVAREGGKKPQRIGLSATVRPIADVARFLSDRATIVDVGHRREMALAVEVPGDELGPVASKEMWGEIYDRVAQQILAHSTTLIFVGTRRMSERVAFALNERLGEGVVMPHHGSLSRETRFDVERRLRAGELRAVVATASLELGIDIGSVDLVVQLGSPRAIAVALQRIGRSGHWIGAKPDGRFYVTTRDELLECAALVRGDPRRRARRAAHPRGAARHPGAADRRRVRAARVGRRRALRDRAPGLSVSRARAARLRRRRLDAGRRRRHLARPQRHVPALRSRQRPAARPPGRAAGGDHLRRGNSRHRQLQRRRRARRSRGGDARRRLRDREHGGRHLPARHQLVEDAPRRGRRRARRRRSRRAALDSVLERRGVGAHDRALARGERRARGDRRARRCRGDRVAGGGVRARPRRRGAGGGLRARGQGDPRRRPDERHDRRGAVLRRGRRHAAGAAHAVRRSHQSRVGSRAAQEVSAARSTSSCRRRRPTTASFSR